MEALAAPYLAAAALLVLAGGSKVVDPLPLVRALHSARLPVGRGRVRVGAAGELLLGLAALLHGSRVAAIGVAASYLVFSAFVLLARRRGGVLASCGCFGKADSPPTASHVVVTGALAAVAVAVAVDPVGPLPDLLAGSPWSGVPLLLVTAAVAGTAYVLLAVLPLLSARAPAMPLPILTSGDGMPTLLAFLADGPASQAFRDAFADPEVQIPAGAQLRIVTDPDAPEWAAFGVPRAPYVVLLSGAGRVVAEGSAPTWPEVADLMSRRQAEQASGSPARR